MFGAKCWFLSLELKKYPCHKLACILACLHAVLVSIWQYCVKVHGIMWRLISQAVFTKGFHCDICPVLQDISRKSKEATAQLEERERLAKQLEEEKKTLEEATSHLIGDLVVRIKSSL